MKDTPRLSWTDVRDTMRARILARDYDLGARLPRDEDIALDLGCTRTTVHRAMQDLEKAGLIQRKRKGGTHVRANPITRAVLDIPLVRREIEEMGVAYSHRLLTRTQALCPAPVAQRFGLSAPRSMLRITALHLAGARPYSFEDRWIDPASGPEILQVDFSVISANEWLVRHKPYSRVEIEFSARAADADLAQVLDCPLAAALLVNTRTTWTGETPITTVQSIAAPAYKITARS